MKHILKTVGFVAGILWSSMSYAGITDAKFSTAQVFDVRYSWDSTTLDAREFTRPFRSTGTSGQLSTTYISDMISNGRTFGFFDSVTTPGTHGFAVYNSNGTLNEVLHETGSFSALGNSAIFYLGNNSQGILISTAKGFTYGDSATFTSMTKNPTDTQIAAYTPSSNAPLGDSETASTTVVTPVYLSSITTVQQATKKTGFAVTTGNNIDLTITGNSNDVAVNQLSDGNYLIMMIAGNSNTTDITQSGTNLTRNFADIDINGSTNIITFEQRNGSEKTAFVDITGNFGTFDIAQKGIGEHFLDLNSNGNNVDITVLQEGLGNHSAVLDLAGTWDLTLTQRGDVDQLFSLPHNLSDNTVVSGVCNSGTCNMVINQQ